MKKLITFLFLLITVTGYTQTVNSSPFTAIVGVETYVPKSALQTLEVGGVAESMQLEYRPFKSAAYILSTGFYYRRPTEELRSIMLIPVLGGVKVYLDSSISLLGTAGFAYTSAGGGYQPMYTAGASVDLNRFNIELKYIV
jgi:hypothetical protein